MLCVGAKADDVTVKFGIGDASSTNSLTKNDVTLTISGLNSFSATSTYWKVSGGQTVTLYCSAGNINKIVFTVNDNR
jgi:hypothetical protein